MSRNESFGDGATASRTRQVHPDVWVEKRYAGRTQIPAPVEGKQPLGPITYDEHVDLEAEIRRSRGQ